MTWFTFCVVDGVALLGVDEVGELDGVFDEEHGGVVAYHVVVSLLGIVLNRETAGVTVAIIGSALTGDGGESEEDRGLLVNLVEELGLAETKNMPRHFLSLKRFRLTG